MRQKIIKLFEAAKGFKPLIRPKDQAPLSSAPEQIEEPVSPIEPQKQEIKKEEHILVTGNKLRGFTLAKIVNGVEQDSHTFPTIDAAVFILSQDAFKNMEIKYRISNDDEALIKSKLEPQKEEPKEDPLDLNFGSSRLLNNRDVDYPTYLSNEEKEKVKQEVVKKIKAKLNNRKEMASEIKQLKSSKTIDPVSQEYMKGHVFNSNDAMTNITRYVRYMIFDELVNYLIADESTKILRTQADIRRRGGNLNPTINELAKELTPSFERYLSRKEKSELFSAFQIN